MSLYQGPERFHPVRRWLGLLWWPGDEHRRLRHQPHRMGSKLRQPRLRGPHLSLYDPLCRQLLTNLPKRRMWILVIANWMTAASPASSRWDPRGSIAALSGWTVAHAGIATGVAGAGSSFDLVSNFLGDYEDHRQSTDDVERADASKRDQWSCVDHQSRGWKTIEKSDGSMALKYKESVTGDAVWPEIGKDKDHGALRGSYRSDAGRGPDGAKT